MFTQPSGQFGAPAFGSTQSFGAQTAPSFGGGFGAAPTQSGFGAAPAQSGFGAAPAQNGFGAPFGGAPPTQSAFGNAPTQSAFGGGSSAFGVASSAFGGGSSSFGGAPTQFGVSGPSAFAPTQQQPAFGAPQTGFGAAPGGGGFGVAPSSFGAQQQGGGGFGIGVQTQPQSFAPQNSFGGFSAAPQPSFQSPANKLPTQSQFGGFGQPQQQQPTAPFGGGFQNPGFSSGFGQPQQQQTGFPPGGGGQFGAMNTPGFGGQQPGGGGFQMGGAPPPQLTILQFGAENFHTIGVAKQNQERSLEEIRLQYYQTIGKVPPSATSGQFGQQQQPTMPGFGQQQPQPAFGGLQPPLQQQQPGFGGQPSMFAPQPSVPFGTQPSFGAPQQQVPTSMGPQPTTNLFGTSQPAFGASQPAFGTSQPSSNLWGQPQQQQQPGGLFNSASQQQQQPSSFFSTATNPAATQQQQGAANLWGKPSTSLPATPQPAWGNTSTLFPSSGGGGGFQAPLNSGGQSQGLFPPPTAPAPGGLFSPQPAAGGSSFFNPTTPATSAFSPSFGMPQQQPQQQQQQPLPATTEWYANDSLQRNMNEAAKAWGGAAAADELSTSLIDKPVVSSPSTLTNISTPTRSILTANKPSLSKSFGSLATPAATTVTTTSSSSFPPPSAPKTTTATSSPSHLQVRFKPPAESLEAKIQKRKERMNLPTEAAAPALVLPTLSAEKEVLPRIVDASYRISPPLEDLALYSMSELGRVSGFRVERPGMGKIEWEGEVDVRGICIGSDVVIDSEGLEVYGNKDRPAVAKGQGLNRPAVVHFFYEPSTPEEGTDLYLSKLIEGMSKSAKFLEFKDNMLTFRVENFSYNEESE